MTSSFLKTILPAVVVLSGLAVTTPAEARFADAPDLADYCAQEAVIRLDVKRNKLIVLPVEQTGGIYHVYVQTDAPNPAFVECQFASNKALQSVHVTGNVQKAGGATRGAPPEAVKLCKQMMGQPSKVLKVSQLRKGYHEIILKETNGSRKVACTAPDAGGQVTNWVEMN